MRARLVLLEAFVAVGGYVVFHDARADRQGGRGLPGPTAVVVRHFRTGGGTPGWEIVAEADRAVSVRRLSRGRSRAAPYSFEDG